MSNFIFTHPREDTSFLPKLLAHLTHKPSTLGTFTWPRPLDVHMVLKHNSKGVLCNTYLMVSRTSPDSPLSTGDFLREPNYDGP